MADPLGTTIACVPMAHSSTTTPKNGNTANPINSDRGLHNRRIAQRFCRRMGREFNTDALKKQGNIYPTNADARENERQKHETNDEEHEFRREHPTARKAR
jgi:hypothetical protein